MNKSNEIGIKRFASCGFTRLDLLVVTTVLLGLSILTFVSLASSRIQSSAIVCLNNHRRLVQSWLLYADDFEERVVNNMGIPATIGAIQSGQFNNWANNVMTWSAGSGTEDRSNTNLVWAAKGLLVPYDKGAIDNYRCPADTFLSALQRSRGWEGRVRSVSMNAFFGRFDPATPSDPTAQGRNWLLSQYRQFLKLSHVPRPAMTWVTLDEHADSINDGYFIVSDNPTQWGDVPASYHNGACVFAFADGHSDMHRWTSATSIYPVTTSSLFLRPFDAAGRADFAWYKERTGYVRWP
ncbi:MAG TPA: hypothetical protein VJW76_08470 [Verrucomicrobiae bacterium]|nr:hypothetical protein [Verrucomicrobiae bacterium]